MQFMSDLLVSILISYLAFTNTLADNINQLFVADESPETTIEEPAQLPGFSFLPSSLSAIPDILLQSAEYQAATVASGAGLTGNTAAVPLDAVVNIFCTFATAQYIKTTTGTGFFIDPDGVILTNAHVAPSRDEAQYLAARFGYGESQNQIMVN